MTVAARRLWLYGLLLLLPALTVGGLALGLLAREQARLAERERAAGDSRRAAVETRARLIAENIELLVGDVQSALMMTLLEAPAAEPRAFLTEWHATNPLVRDVFRATADGRAVWGATGDPLRAWLGQGAPWVEARSPAPAAAPLLADGSAAAVAPQERIAAEPEKKTEPVAAPQIAEARRDISNNVIQYQRARQEIQEVAKLRNSADVAAKVSSEQALVTAGVGAAAAPSPPSPPAASAAPASDPVASSVDSASPWGLRLAEGLGEADADLRLRAKDQAAVSQAAAFVAPVEPLTRSGWTPWRDASGLHLFGWRELPDRTVIGLELRLDAIKARLGEVFPSAPEAGESYALRDASGAAWHRVGDEGLPVALEVPLAAAALPGWAVVAHALAAGTGSSTAGGVFAIGSSLVGLLVFAILAAGALLVRQARRSEIEAAQKTSFVANVSHELKTPLTTIRLYAELLAQGRVRDEAKRADYLATIGQETQRLARLVGNVLDFSRLEQGKKRYDLAAVDLAAELRRLAEMHAPRLAAAGLRLQLEAPETLAVTTDRDAVEQIVLNLLDNACKYAAEGGEALLALASEVAGGDVRVVVADRGPGVPEGQCERIFEKFHRVDDRLTAEKGGAGLGLSIARQLARGLGGDLRCEVRAGGGSAFVLTLPLSP